MIGHLCDIMVARGRIEPAVNRESWDTKLDNSEPLVWWSVEQCAIAGCKHFKNARAWSMISEEKVIAYVKHHLMKCDVIDHRVRRSDADNLVESLDVEALEWLHEDRLAYQQEADERQSNKKRKTQEGDDERGSAGSSAKASAHDAKSEDAVANSIAIKVARALQVTQKSTPAQQPAPTGLLTIGDATPTLQLALPAASSDEQLVIQSLERCDAAIKAAMHQCITNARNLQHEQLVIDEALRVLRRRQ